MVLAAALDLPLHRNYCATGVTNCAADYLSKARVVDFSETLEFAGSQPVVRGVAAAGVVAALLWGFQREWPGGSRRWLLAVGAAAVALVGVLAVVYVTAKGIVSPPEWDFLCYWVYGQAMALGGSPFDPVLLREVAAPLDVSDEFRRELYCMYPPPSTVQFWPLGWLRPQVAAALWYSIQWLAAGSVAALVWRLLDERRRWTGLLVACALIFSLHSTISTFRFGQTNLLIVLAALAATLSAKPMRRGLWIGLATVVKPIGAILALDLLLKRDWKGLVGVSIPLALATLIFLALQGWQGLEQYRNKPRLPDDVQATFFTESTNQSLLATLLRATETAPGPRPILFPPFVVAAGLLTAITLVVVARLPRELSHLGIGCVLALALLVYPGTLTHYSIGLIVPIAAAWSVRERLRGGTPAVIVMAALAYGLVWSRLEFAANLAVWTAMMGMLVSARSLPRSEG